MSVSNNFLAWLDAFRTLSGSNCPRISNECSALPYSPFVLLLRVAILNAWKTSCFGYRLDVLTSRQRIFRKPLTEESGQQVSIRNEPCLHALHHQVRMFVARIGRALPLIAGFQVVPRLLCHGDFHCRQGVPESHFGRRWQEPCSNSQMRHFGCHRPQRLAFAPRGPPFERIARSRGGIGSATPGRLRLLRRRLRLSPAVSPDFTATPQLPEGILLQPLGQSRLFQPPHRRFAVLFLADDDVFGGR